MNSKFIKNGKGRFWIWLTIILVVTSSIGLFASAQTNTNLKIIALGDSIVSGVGATAGHNFVELLSTRIGSTIINAGVNGDTTTSAWNRLDRDVINQDPDIVIVFLGGNDILQRMPKDQMFRNLKIIVERIQDSGAKVILIGIHAEVFNIDYETGFQNLAIETGATYVPNVLSGIIGHSTYMADTVHPNNEGHKLIADRIFPALQNTINSLGNQGLSVTCTVNPSLAQINGSATWSAYANGGNGNYRYSWSGTDNLFGSDATINKTYSSSGSKSATVTVTSGDLSSSASCSMSVREAVLTGWCSPDVYASNSSQYYIAWHATLLGYSTSTPNFTWTGTDGLVGSSTSVSKQYSTGGQKDATVLMNADNQQVSLTCSAKRPDYNQTSTSTTLGGSCRPQLNGLSVRWLAQVSDTHSGTTTYSWSGSEGLIGTTSEFTHLYSTEGIKRATVLINRGNETVIATCEAKIASTTGSTSGCFIATAAFGTEMEPQVQTLRKFRDEKLLTNKVGQLFVKTYYKVSPPIADFIRTRENFKAVVRVGLEPLVYMVENLE